MKFSRRIGKNPIRDTFQTDSMDLILRNRLWNILNQHIISPAANSRYLPSTQLYGLFTSLWHNQFGAPTDTIDMDTTRAVGQFREKFYSVEWFEVYEILEHVLSLHLPILHIERGDFVRDINLVMEQEMAGYRILDNIFTPLTSADESQAIENAIEETLKDKLGGVNIHLRSALAKLSDRKQPDYRNSIKESISAVESLTKLIAADEKAALRDALKVLEAKIEIHKALKNAFSNLYGYTSDQQGIRHALLDVPNVDFEDAKFMLITCSAFISFLLGKCAKAKIPL